MWLFDLLQAAGGHEIRVRADRPLRQVLRHLGAVGLAYECPTHGPSIAPGLRDRHRQLSGSKLTTGQRRKINHVRTYESVANLDI